MTGALILATIVHWAVPAMSEVMRLPDAVPVDGEKDGTVTIVAARDEYEPGSFVVRSDVDLGKVKFEIGDTFEAVHVSTPDHTHAYIAIDCMNAGKHVYVQKPLAHTFEDCGSQLSYAAPLTEALLIGCISLRYPGQELKFDPVAKRFTNNEDANRRLKAPARGEWNFNDIRNGRGLFGKQFGRSVFAC